jgi:hypothetical protein
MLIRGAALGVVAACSDGFDDSEFGGSDLVALGAMALMGGSALWDVLTVASDVERANASRVSRVSLAPRLPPTGRGAGFALSAGF